MHAHTYKRGIIYTYIPERIEASFSVSMAEKPLKACL